MSIFMCVVGMLRSAIVLGVLFLSLSASFAQKFSLSNGSVSKKDFLIEIPIIDTTMGYAIIPVEVNGKPYKFLFDTGAPNILHEDIFEYLPDIHEIKVKDGNNKFDEVSVKRIDTLSLGEVDFLDFGAISSSFMDMFPFRCLDISGVVGSNIFGGLAVQIDYKQRKIIVTDQPKKILGNKKGVPLKLIGDQLKPFVEIKLKGEKRNASEQLLFDSGYSGFYESSTRAFMSFKEYGVYSRISEGEGRVSMGMLGADQISSKYAVEVGQLSVNDVSFVNVPSVTSNDPDGKLGAGLFRYGTVTLDFLKGKFYFESNLEQFDLVRPQQKILATVQDDKIVVGVVLDQELRSQIHVGDEILGFDQVDFLNLSACDVIQSWQSRKNIETVKIKTNGGHVINLQM